MPSPAPGRMHARPLAALGLAAIFLASCSKKPPPGESTPLPEARATVSSVTSASAAPVTSASAAPTARASAAPVARVPRTTCPKTLADKPEAWRGRLVGAATQSARDAALAEIDLGWPAPGVDDEGKALPAWKLDSAAVTKVPLASARPEDYWVDLRFSEEHPGAPSQAVRTAALIKQPDGTYCALAGPAAEQAVAYRACLGGPDTWPIEILLFHVVDKDRMTIASVESSGRCDGCGRLGQSEVRFLDVQGFDLAEVFKQELFFAEYNGCPWPPEELRRASVEWVGPYPRDVFVVDEHVCADPGMLRPGSTTTCKPEATETRFAFRGGSYVSIGSRQVASPYDHHVPLAEGGLDDGSGRAWAGRCYRRLQDAKLDDAEADCRRALARSTDKEIRASAYYNMALVAEKRSDTSAACGFLRESLAIRPNNATTKAKRAALCP